MTASAVPDVEDPAFPAKRLSATVADNHSLVFTAYLASSAFGRGYHENFSQIPFRYFLPPLCPLKIFLTDSFH
jgi:hypothetical protein